MTRLGASTACCLLMALAPAFAAAATFEVGPGQPLAGLNEVPWESLGPGDTVLLHWRSTPYKEKFVLCRQGTEAQPIVVRGVRGPGGERPIIDGDGATTRAALNFWNEDRGVIKIGGANAPADTMPRWIVLEGLDVTSGRPPFSFTGRNGLTDYAKNAAALYVEKGENITIRDCVIRDSGNGLFCGSQTRDLLVEGNELRDNGIEGSFYEHNNYTAAVGITFQFNLFRPLRTGCGGNNLKDRSVGTVIRYNWIEGGNRNLDLVDAEDDPTLTSDPRYRSTFVYGNVFIKLEGGNNQVIHYGGDSGDTDIYRKGTLHLFNNTLVSTRSGNTTLLRLSTNEERADVRNNVLYVAAGGASLAMVDETGVVDLRNNWSKPGWVDCHGALQGTINDLGGAVTGASPGFVDEVAQDYRLASGAACIDRGAALHAAVLPAHALGWQYVPHQSGELRPMSGSLDLGAFEHCPGGSCIGLADAGFASVDGAASSEDATAPADASPSARDGTAPSPDADEEALDASTVMGADASPATAGPDAATAPDLAGVTSSCGCSASEAGPTAGLWAGWMALLWSVRLRALRR